MTWLARSLARVAHAFVAEWRRLDVRPESDEKPARPFGFVRITDIGDD